jgi:hypothetical protein
MRRKKQLSGPDWFIWEGEDFPRELHSDSVVFYINEHADLDTDEVARLSLARQMLQEGISDSLGEAFKYINDSSISTAGYRYEEYDETTPPLYCDSDDPDLDYDATFVEVPYVG